MFERRRDLFTGLDMVFFDTTSLYFEDDGGETIGQYGYSIRDRADVRLSADRQVVADRGMISKETIAELERENIHYILGCGCDAMRCWRQSCSMTADTKRSLFA